MKKTLIISYAILILSLLFIGYFSYLAFFPFNVIKYDTTTLPVINKEVSQGENLYYVLGYCKYMNIIPDVKKSFVNDLLYNLPPSNPITFVGCRNQTNFINIPAELPLGKYRMNIDVTYKINFLQSRHYQLQTEEFTVVSTKTD